MANSARLSRWKRSEKKPPARLDQARTARPDCGVTAPRLLALRAADGQAVVPWLLDLLGQAVIRAADGEGNQPMRGGILVGLLDTGVGPVGAAERADLAGFRCSFRVSTIGPTGTEGSSRCRTSSST